MWRFRVLNITRSHELPTRVVLRPEGRIVGDWVQVLEHEVRLLLQVGCEVRLDCSDVVFLGPSGAEMLLRIESDGVRITRCPPLIEAVLRSASEAPR